MKSLLDRLADKVLIGDGCWEWTGAHDPRGYGLLGLNGTNVGAHRVMYELLVGPIPEGLTLDHLCRNLPCVRPDHLEPVTMRENTMRGNNPDAQRARHAAVTHCPKGHEYTPENTRIRNRQGYACRSCRTCEREARRRRR